MTSIEALSLVQGSPEWEQFRCGKITASRAADVIAMTKKGEAAARRDYRTELIVERLTNIPVPQYVTREMEWGIQQEPFARAAYELDRGILVETAGFVLHSAIPYFGCSPDGLVGDDGLIQIKCPNTTTHIEWLRAGVVPLEHQPQMIAELSCTGREWADFVSFDPRLPEHLQLFVRRLARNQQHVSVLESEVAHFETELQESLAALPPAGPAAKLLEMPMIDEPPLTEEDCPF